MRTIVLALLAAGGLAMAGAAPAEAFGTRYPFCLLGQDHPALSDCTYTSYYQCQATAAGLPLYCVENPYFNPGYCRDGRPYPRGHRGRARSVYPVY